MLFREANPLLVLKMNIHNTYWGGGEGKKVDYLIDIGMHYFK